MFSNMSEENFWGHKIEGSELNETGFVPAPAVDEVEGDEENFNRNQETAVPEESSTAQDDSGADGTSVATVGNDGVAVSSGEDNGKAEVRNYPPEGEASNLSTPRFVNWNPESSGPRTGDSSRSGSQTASAGYSDEFDSDSDASENPMQSKKEEKIAIGGPSRTDNNIIPAQKTRILSNRQRMANAEKKAAKTHSPVKNKELLSKSVNDGNHQIAKPGKEKSNLQKHQARQLAVLAVEDRVSEELRVMREQIRQYREKSRKQDLILRERNTMLQRTIDRNKQLQKTLKEKGISAKKSKPSTKIEDLQYQLDAKDKRIKELERKIELTTKNHRHQLNIEIARHNNTLRKLRFLEDELKISKPHFSQKRLSEGKDVRDANKGSSIVKADMKRPKKKTTGDKMKTEQVDEADAIVDTNTNAVSEDGALVSSLHRKSRKSKKKSKEPVQIPTKPQTSSRSRTDSVSLTTGISAENEFAEPKTNDELPPPSCPKEEIVQKEALTADKDDILSPLALRNGLEFRETDSGFESIVKDRAETLSNNHLGDPLFDLKSPPQGKKKISFEADENPFDSILGNRESKSNASSILDDLLGPKPTRRAQQVSASDPPMPKVERTNKNIFDFDDDDLFPSLVKKQSPVSNGRVGSGKPLVDTRGSFPWEQESTVASRKQSARVHSQTGSNGHIFDGGAADA